MYVCVRACMRFLVHASLCVNMRDRKIKNQSKVCVRSQSFQLTRMLNFTDRERKQPKQRQESFGTQNRKSVCWAGHCLSETLSALLHLLIRERAHTHARTHMNIHTCVLSFLKYRSTISWPECMTVSHNPPAENMTVQQPASPLLIQSSHGAKHYSHGSIHLPVCRPQFHLNSENEFTFQWNFE